MQSKDSAVKWTTTSLDSVVSGASTMSQRKLSSVKIRGGGLSTARTLAKKLREHLLGSWIITELN